MLVRSTQIWAAGNVILEGVGQDGQRILITRFLLVFPELRERGVWRGSSPGSAGEWLRAAAGHKAE